MTGPLNGYKILDLSCGVAGPLVGMFFADYGAEVIKIEPPGGDPFRKLPAYAVWNRGKKSVTLNLKGAPGREVIHRLMRGADVLIETWSAGTSERLGLDYPTLTSHFPQLVYCSISGYGHPDRDREHPGYEALVAAASGLCQEQPGFRDGPNFLFFPVTSYGAAFAAAIGIVAALYQRGTSGVGQRVETSMFGGAIASLALQMSWAENPTANLATPSHSSAPGKGSPTADAYRCGDGRYLYIHTGARGSFQRLCDLIGCDAGDFPRYYPAHFVGHPEQAARFRPLVEKAFLTRPMLEWAAILQREDIAVGPCLEPGEMLQHEQALANDLALQLDDPRFGPLTQVGLAIKFHESPGEVRGPAPVAGRDTTEVLGSLGYSPDQINDLRRNGIV
ncbi:MAG TPA: CoA transferase [Candidatus Binataceae bacterium]|jgi:crotonobetainyl-CoA:carnitine CoA-transferase CaiB-like acyl-CoA transferase|nr:CoA transferase [Candidatus Binataceae bacterium]